MFDYKFNILNLFGSVNIVLGGGNSGGFSSACNMVVVYNLFKYL